MSEKMHLESADDAPVRFTKKSKSAAVQGNIDMTPMVDVVFQLLTFFLLAVKRDSQEQVDVPITIRSTAVAEAESTFITIQLSNARGVMVPRVVVGENRSSGIILDKDDPRKGKDLTAKVAKRKGNAKAQQDELDRAVRTAVEEAVRKGRPHIIIKAERLVRHGDVLRVCRIVKGIEGAFLYVGVQSKDG